MAEGAGNGFAECRLRFLRLRGEVGCEKTLLLPELAADGGEVSAKVGCDLRYQAAVATARRAWGGGRAASRATSENSASRHGVERAFRPLALGLDPEVVAHLAEGDVDLPAPDIPSEDLQRFARRIGAKESLRIEPAHRIAQQNPADWHDRQSGMTTD